MSVIIEKITPANELAEGPHWDNKSQKLYYVDIVQQKILKLDPATGEITFAYLKNGPIGVVVPVEDTEDKLIVGCGLDVFLITWDGKSDSFDPPIKKLASFDIDRTDTRINDGKCDIAGRLWAGTMAIENDTSIEPNRGSLYSLNKDLIVKKEISSISISNGITWTSDNNTMYYIDSLAYQIWAFDFNLSDGSIKNKKVIFNLKKNNIDGLLDGMTIDTDGNLWIALFNGSSVLQVNPKNGELLRIVKLPVNKVTSVAFGGSDFNVLYVTTARMLINDGNEVEPDSGCLYSIKGLGVQGYPPNNFKYIF